MLAHAGATPAPGALVITDGGRLLLEGDATDRLRIGDPVELDGNGTRRDGDLPVVAARWSWMQYSRTSAGARAANRASAKG